MPTVLRAVIATLVILLGVASMGMIDLKDDLTQPQYCADCHQEPHYNSWVQSNFLANKHAKAAIRCQTCHPQTMGTGLHNLIEHTKGNQGPRPLRIPKQVCLQCHAHSSYPDLIEQTADYERNPHDSHYGEIDCRICHKMHQHSVDYCSACHDRIASGPGWVFKKRMNIQRGKPPSVMPSELFDSETVSGDEPEQPTDEQAKTSGPS